MVNQVSQLPVEKEYLYESAMQADIFQYFWNNYPVTRRRLFHVPNGGSRNKVEAVRLRAQGVVKGITDLIGLGDKGFFALELKIKGGIVSDDQKLIHQLWTSLGYRVYVAWSYEEALSIIKKEFSL
jgi:hypothetical protein